MMKALLFAALIGTVVGCGQTEFCCPEALHCLTPTNVTCLNKPNACAADETCCGLTDLCVKVGIPCVPQPVCPSNSYCCPDAKHCLAPVHPGVLCKPGDCEDGATCCPLTNLCVLVGPNCTAPRAGCDNSSYCCPDAKHCLEPTQVTCPDGKGCSSDEVCCPLTKLCVKVKNECTPICPSDSYCCPDAKHCLKPANPGHLCTPDSCPSGQTCCPLTHECVIVGDACNP